MVSSASDAASRDAASPLERVLRRDGVVVIAGLAALWAATATIAVTGAGLGMDAWEMTRMAWLPSHHAAPRGDMDCRDMRYAFAPWTPARVALLVAMWWTMMIAMMTPSATPTALLYARVHRHAAARGGVAAATAPTGVFVAGYLLAWGAFSVVAAALQVALQAGGVLSAMTMGLSDRVVAGAVLVAAGAYQFSPWKDACLAQCRSPAAFLARWWRPGTGAALRLGARHGAWCLGCCAPLMALLFVGGAMNLAWIAALTALVVAEKWAPHGRGLGRIAGVGLVAWGVSLFA